MQSIRNAILWHVRAKRPTQTLKLVSTNQMCTTTAKARYTDDDDDDDQTMDRVIALVKKFDKIDASKVTETADFQKDLSLDSLDRVELVMAFEQEFAVEIPDEKADKLTCCADVANYIASTATAMKTT